MLDKYAEAKSNDPTRPNPLMWTEVTRSDQAWQDRKEDMLSHIRPLHEENAGQFAEQDEDMQGAWEEYNEWRDERDEELREAIELSAQEW